MSLQVRPRGPNGRPTRIIGTVQDITIRRESEQALRESQAEARKLSLVASKTDNLVIIGSPTAGSSGQQRLLRVMEFTLEESSARTPASCWAARHGLRAGRPDPRRDREGHGTNTEIIHYSKSGGSTTCTWRSRS